MHDVLSSERPALAPSGGSGLDVHVTQTQDAILPYS